MKHEDFKYNTVVRLLSYNEKKKKDVLTNFKC